MRKINDLDEGKHFEELCVLFDNMPVPITLADTAKDDVPLVLANAAFLELVGYEAKEVLGRNCRFLQGSIDQAEARAEVRNAVANRNELQIVLRNVTKEGREFDNLLFLFPIGGGDRYILGSQFELPEQDSVSASVRRAELLDGKISDVIHRGLALRQQSRRMRSEAVAGRVREYFRTWR